MIERKTSPPPKGEVASLWPATLAGHPRAGALTWIGRWPNPAHTMHTCGRTRRVQNGANTMKSITNDRKTPRNTWQAGSGRLKSVPASAPVGPSRPLWGRSSHWSRDHLNWSAPVGPCRPLWGRASHLAS